MKTFALLSFLNEADAFVHVPLTRVVRQEVAPPVDDVFFMQPIEDLQGMFSGAEEGLSGMTASAMTREALYRGLNYPLESTGLESFYTNLAASAMTATGHSIGPDSNKTPEKFKELPKKNKADTHPECHNSEFDPFTDGRLAPLDPTKLDYYELMEYITIQKKMVTHQGLDPHNLTPAEWSEFKLLACIGLKVSPMNEPIHHRVADHSMPMADFSKLTKAERKELDSLMNKMETMDGDFDPAKLTETEKKTLLYLLRKCETLPLVGPGWGNPAARKTYSGPASPTKKAAMEKLVDFKNAYYVGEVEFGSPPQKLMMDFDTGSSDVWVTSGIEGWTSYECSASETCKEFADKPFHLFYGRGNAAGMWVRDTVKVSGVGVDSFPVGVATKVQDMSSMGPMSGLLGMAFQNMAQGGDAFFSALFRQNTSLLPRFGMYTGNNGGNLVLGGTDHSKIEGELSPPIPLTRAEYWEVELQGIKETFTGKSVPNMKNAIVDSGTSLLVGPPEQVELIGRAIGAMLVGKAPRQFYVRECNKEGGISFRLGGRDYELTGADMTLQEFETQGMKICQLGLAALPGLDNLILGDVFMRKYYVEHDYFNQSIALGSVKKEVQSAEEISV